MMRNFRDHSKSAGGASGSNLVGVQVPLSAPYFKWVRFFELDPISLARPDFRPYVRRPLVRTIKPKRKQRTSSRRSQPRNVKSASQPAKNASSRKTHLPIGGCSTVRYSRNFTIRLVRKNEIVGGLGFGSLPSE